MARIAAEVLNEVGTTDPLAGRVHTSFTSFLKTARAYAPNAEGGYLQARALEG
jgi:hypothetical protein